MSDAVTCYEVGCNRKVNVMSCHNLCNSHRLCNNEGKFDPDRCSMYKSLFAQANGNSNLAAYSKLNISHLLSSVRSSTAYVKPLNFY